MRTLRRAAIALIVIAAALVVTGGQPPQWAKTALARVHNPQGNPSAVVPAAHLDGPWPVARVVDGDTIVVARAGKKIKIRLIGIDTPETVKPGTPVQCYGRQASAFAKTRLTGRKVWLESDPVAGHLDKYGRTLAYVWLSNTDSFNADALSGGYAREYTYRRQAYRHRADFLAFEAHAQRLHRGLWAACPKP